MYTVCIAAYRFHNRNNVVHIILCACTPILSVLAWIIVLQTTGYMPTVLPSYGHSGARQIEFKPV